MRTPSHRRCLYAISIPTVVGDLWLLCNTIVSSYFSISGRSPERSITNDGLERKTSLTRVHDEAERPVSRGFERGRRTVEGDAGQSPTHSWRREGDRRHGRRREKESDDRSDGSLREH